MNIVHCSPFKTPSTKLHTKSSHPGFKMPSTSGLKIARQTQLTLSKNINRNQQELKNLGEKLEIFEANKKTSPKSCTTHPPTPVYWMPLTVTPTTKFGA